MINKCQVNVNVNVLTVENLVISVKIVKKKAGKLKNKFKMLKINDKEQEELLIKII